MKRYALFALILLIASTSQSSDYWSENFLNVPGEYPTIQAAIDAASNGETVLISAGTYTGIGNKNLDMSGKTIVIASQRKRNMNYTCPTNL